MLVLVALLLFGLVSLVGLVSDLGMVTLTRVQMQQAADAAALEGLRQRNPASTDDGFRGDCLRRSAASRAAARVFDDDFDDLTTDAMQFGAGPLIETTGGTTVLNAGQTIVVAAEPSARVYKPILQRNQPDNTISGDMVSGILGPPAEPGGDEASDYTRADFVPAPPVPPGTTLLAECPPDDDFTGVPPSGVDPIRDPAFLVRLRRTADREGLDAIDGVSSNAPPLPYLFARDGVMGPNDGGGAGPRTDGVTVRATAIATVRPALGVGTGVGLLSAIPLALDLGFWQNGCWDNNQTPVSVDPATGVVTALDACGGVRAGQHTAVALTIAGDLVQPAPADGVDLYGYAALVAVMPTTGLERVVGFGWVSLAGGVLTKFPDRVAPLNATAHLPGGLPPELTVAERAEVIRLNREAGSLALPLRRRPLYAPVVGRE